MAASRRLHKELEELRKSPMKNFRDIQVDESNILTWLIVPDNPPYDEGAFRIVIDFPSNYPFKPPTITFKTQIYHPRITEKGLVCVCGPDSILTKKWDPRIRLNQVIQAIIDLLNDPESFGPLGGSCADKQAREYLNDRETFLRRAEEFTRRYGEERPTD